jgi:hypothetical protein
MDYCLMPLRRYAEFSGRSRRKEFWLFELLLIVVSVVISTIEGIVDSIRRRWVYGPLSALLVLATIVPASLSAFAGCTTPTGQAGGADRAGADYRLLRAAVLYVSDGQAAPTGSARPKDPGQAEAFA